MTINAAKEKDLGELHSKVAKVMTNALSNLEVQQELFTDAVQRFRDDPESNELLATAIEKAPEVNASLLSVMTKFLSDNKISCAPEESTEMSGLQSVLNRKNKRRTVGNVVHITDDE